MKRNWAERGLGDCGLLALALALDLDASFIPFLIREGMRPDMASSTASLREEAVITGSE